MDTATGGGLPGTFREAVRDTARYWEPRRVVYNFILVAVVVAWVVATWPHFRPAFKVQSVPPLLVLAVIANGCYCAAHLVDIAMRYSPMRSTWHRRRSGLWLAGTAFAVVLACYWIADEIYPYVD